MKWPDFDDSIEISIKSCLIGVVFLCLIGLFQDWTDNKTRVILGLFVIINFILWFLYIIFFAWRETRNNKA